MYWIRAFTARLILLAPLPCPCCHRYSRTGMRCRTSRQRRQKGEGDASHRAVTGLTYGTAIDSVRRLQKPWKRRPARSRDGTLSIVPEIRVHRLKRFPSLFHPLPSCVRYLEPSQTSTQAEGGSRGSGSGTGSRGVGNRPPAASTPTSTPSTTPRSAISSFHSPETAAVASVRTDLVAEATAATAPPATPVVAAAPPSQSGLGLDTSLPAAAAGAKRPRVVQNPYHRHSSQQKQRREQGHHHQQQQRNGDAAAREWEGAETLVVGEGGQAVPGRGHLDWCGVCGAHVLRTDAEVSSLRTERLLHC